MDARGFVRVLREAALATRSEPLPADPVSQLTEAELAELRRGARRRQVAAWRRVAAMSASA